MDAEEPDIKNTDYQQEEEVDKDSLHLHVQPGRELVQKEEASETSVINQMQNSQMLGITLPQCNQEAFIFCLDDSIYECKNHANVSDKPLKLKIYSMSKSDETDVLVVMNERFSGTIPMECTLSEPETDTTAEPGGSSGIKYPPKYPDTSTPSTTSDEKKQTSKGRHLCEHCGKNFTRKLSVSRHIKNVHSGSQKQYKCHVCDKVYKDYSNFQQHVNGKHKGIFKYTCANCGKGYNRLMQFKVHMSTHTGKMLFKCEICSEEFLWKHYLTVHMRKHRGEFPFQCDQCEKKFHSSSRLVNHKRTHVEFKELIKKKQCVFCNKKFETKRDLDNHERVHTGAKAFSCNLCERAYTSKSALKEHLKTHGERDIACPVCEKTFHKMFVFKEHMKIHTQEMPFMCQFCAKRYRYGSNFRAHEKNCARRHNEKV
ncbi:uncharacterized protein [Amphiura filiformis]|uniref:uncharacterized protein n=1 Tax=Amphiura filiformis TaxID=82378 RepID=UPI003B22853F